MRVVAISLAFRLLAVAPPATTPPPRRVVTPEATVELITSSRAPVDGELWAGVRFEIRPGWHIYWRNPGDSGAPPRVAWMLPAGVEPSDWIWPAPSRIPVGPLVNYGYETTVTLPVRFTVPAATTTFHATAALRWLICRDVCVTRKATLELSVPLDQEMVASVPRWGSEIRAARRAEPTAASPDWRVAVRSRPDRFVLTIQGPGVTEAPLFFPLDESQVDDAAPQARSFQDGVAEVALQKSDQLTKDPTALRGVVTFGSGQSFVITAPVRRNPS